MSETRNGERWSDSELAALNEAWFAGYSLRYCDNVSGCRCVTERVQHERTFDPILRIVWGWCGGSAESGLLWGSAAGEPRASRAGKPWTKNELDAVSDIDAKRATLPAAKAELLTDEYIASLLNRTVDEVGQARRKTNPEPPSLKVF